MGYTLNVVTEHDGKLTIDPADCCRAAEAKRILKSRGGRALLHGYAEQFIVATVDGVCFYSRRALREYVAARPTILTVSAVAKRLCISGMSVRNLDAVLQPVFRPWGDFKVVREYDPARVERVAELRAQALQSGCHYVTHDAYASLLVEASTAPDSSSLPATFKDPKVRGKAPVQRTKVKAADSAPRRTEEIKEAIATMIDIKEFKL